MLSMTLRSALHGHLREFLALTEEAAHHGHDDEHEEGNDDDELEVVDRELLEEFLNLEEESLHNIILSKREKVKGNIVFDGGCKLEHRSHEDMRLGTS